MLHTIQTYLLLTLFSFYCSTAVSADLLIKDIKIISKKGQISKPTQVWIKNGVIAALDDGDTVIPTGNYDIVNGKEHYLIPGLIDSHVHLAGVPGESENTPADVRQAALQQIPRSYLYFGFTTLLDIISTDEFVNEWNQQAISPTAYHCSGVPIPGGYPLASLPADQQLSHPAASFYLHDPRQALLMQNTPNSHSHTAQPLVAAITHTQSRCIKAFYEKGFGPFKDLPVPSVAMMRELVAEAHQHGLPVYIHGNSVESHEFALKTGVDLIVHGTWHLNNTEGLPSPAKQLRHLARKSAAQGVGVQPTIQTIFGELEILKPSFFDNHLLEKAIPHSLINWYKSPEGQWFAESLAKNFGEGPRPELYQTAKKAYHAPLENVRTHLQELHTAKAPLYFGSDTPSGPIYSQFPGFNGREEINRWAEQGIPLLALFQSLTIENAKLLRLEHKIGSVEIGKTADLLILKENPLETVSAYDSIEWVVLGGEAIQRESLAAQ